MKRSTGTVEAVLEKYASHFSEVIIRPARGGRYDIYLDDQLIFSKANVWRYPGQDAVVELIRKAIDG